MNVLVLPEPSRNLARLIAGWEDIIVANGQWLIDTPRPSNPWRRDALAQNTTALAEERNLVLKEHPEITREILTQVHAVLDARCGPKS